MKATFIRKLEGFTGDARLYRVEPPTVKRRWDEDAPIVKFEHVVVSAAYVMFSGPETYIFGADENGNVIDWTELDGSFKGDLNHEVALRGAGYEVLHA